jgi:hypothetical protein
LFEVATGAGLVFLGLQFADASRPQPTDGILILWILASLVLYVTEVNAMLMYCFEMTAADARKPPPLQRWTPPPAYSVALGMDGLRSPLETLEIHSNHVLNTPVIVEILPTYEEAIQMSPVVAQHAEEAISPVEEEEDEIGSPLPILLLRSHG